MTKRALRSVDPPAALPKPVPKKSITFADDKKEADKKAEADRKAEADKKAEADRKAEADKPKKAPPPVPDKPDHIRDRTVGHGVRTLCGSLSIAPTLMPAQHPDGSFVKPPLPSQSELPKKEVEAPKAEAPKAQEPKKDDVARELADVKKELAPVRT